MAKKINLGVPDEMSALAMPTSPGSVGGPDGSAGPGDGGSQSAGPAMSYPELHADNLDPESGIEGLPDEGDAQVHYKVTNRGKHTVKHGKNKGKEKHSVSMEIHHMTPSGSGAPQESEGDQVRKSARSFFQGEDQAKQKSKAEAEPDSTMPG